MPDIQLKGVSVSFPFEPYACQVDYMEKVIQCLQTNSNGLLESPTGTGKTLCLLCACCSWLIGKKAMWQQHKAAIAEPELAEQLLHSTGLKQGSDSWGGMSAHPKIIYASRTHSQLSQAVQELKRTSYNHFKVSVLGSREQLCIHPGVQKETNNTSKVHMCRAKVQARSCHFYNNLENGKLQKDYQANVVDIEDLVTLGEKHKVCPYYMARELKKEAEIIFMPYNYLLDPKSRRAHGIELSGNVIIFDEAHNLEKICEESASFDLKAGDLAMAIEELGSVLDKALELAKEEDNQDIEGVPPTNSDVIPDLQPTELYSVKAMMLKLEEAIDQIEIKDKTAGLTKPGVYIFELFGTVELTYENKNRYIEVLDKAIQHLTNDESSGFQNKGQSLSKFCDVIKIVFSRDPDEVKTYSMVNHQHSVAKHFKVHIQDEVSDGKKSARIDDWTKSTKSQKKGRTLSYWCFSPGHTMEDLKAHNVKSIILTSGTLAPLESFKTEMRIQFDVQLENPHVIKQHQVYIGSVCKGPDGTLLNSSYETRFTTKYQNSLGNSLVNFARVVPNGLLVFFPSYPVMNGCVKQWQQGEGNIWGRLTQHKPIFIEPRGKVDFQTAMEEFYEAINDESKNGAIFIAVCRGKVSEGLDFADINGRAVVITGLPYPPMMDPKVKLKMQFLDEMKIKMKEGLTGRAWYKQQASRAVNQAIGRVIRHRQDYGAILLCDNRFSNADNVNQLPLWLRPKVTSIGNFGQAVRDLTEFYRTAEKTMPAPKPTRKRIGAGDKACETAYFEPTINRGAGVNVLAASRIENHVKSLKRVDSADVSITKLKIAYEGDDTSPTAAPVNLLDALESTQKPLIDTMCSPEPVKPTSHQLALEKKKLDLKRGTKRKLVVKPNKPKQETKIPEATPSSAPSINKHMAESISYLEKVKLVLSGASYKMFSGAMLAYKQKEDFTNLVTVLAELFTEDKRHEHLFRGFYKYVKPKHKKEFDQMCKDITGLDCDYKPEHSLSKQHRTVPSKQRTITPSFPLGNKSGAIAEVIKRRKLAPVASGFIDKGTLLGQPKDNMNTKASSKTTAVCDDIPLSSSSELIFKMPHTSSPPHNSNKINHTQMTGASSHSNNTADSVESTIDGPENIKTTTNPASNSHDISDSIRLNGKIVQMDKNLEAITSSGYLEKKQDNSADVSIDLDISLPQTKPLANKKDITINIKVHSQTGCANNVDGDSSKKSSVKPKDDSKPQKTTGYTCGRCKQDAKVPCKALCEHVCCITCWKDICQGDKLCPVCSSPVRKRHLERIYFPHGPNKQNS
ncbi:unnamed protein product [Owenia fusiformis]|uniref:Regulator of telomere elongation helicase 1 homolog n=1 Tax=Owenia fusiformis TaxID=6347 RepID=A0A8S4N1D0_OWEFU|nr:unnamed protein product [Owenia fusiformis]